MIGGSPFGMLQNQRLLAGIEGFRVPLRYGCQLRRQDWGQLRRECSTANCVLDADWMNSLSKSN